ncbi:MAG TPA: hypothetical protein PKG54_14815 [Phycisphaerae bacterium]|jgi:hypothetical protein|nr:hypothetical protein [Phycisphaerae bacterium]HOB75786.1 hypothetical protein [Phycisphaerae bacterium]HOJ55582.1 hypothetical protein [Phycisphaerae bacterium]HOL27722.1 hypothetical protein [Phycisphaerae bacterium]HPP21896.1 hypothetical protein [Phycisphaerae bacterium]
MTKSQWVTRIGKAMIVVASGTTILGTSCGVEVRNAVIAAGAEFVGASLGTVLETLFPISDILAGWDDASA